jgi:hypothetical protein
MEFLNIFDTVAEFESKKSSLKIPYTAMILEDGSVRYEDKSNGHYYVDLALPSRTMWSLYNIGGYVLGAGGSYLPWGHLSNSTNCSWKNYRWWDKDSPAPTKNTIWKYNTSDKKTILEVADDAGVYNYGGKWRMPSVEQGSEIMNSANCTKTYETVNGKACIVLTSTRNGNRLVLPRNGRRDGQKVNENNSAIWYMTRQVGNDQMYGRAIRDGFVGNSSRRMGLSARPTLNTD